MGIAFRNLKFAGAMCPGLSFNRSEKVHVNLGQSPFKFSPPDSEYLPYTSNIQRTIAEYAISNRALSSSFSQYITDQGRVASLVFEDCLEDKRGDAECDWKRRFFPSKNSSAGPYGSKTVKRFFPRDALSLSDPPKAASDFEGKKGLHYQFVQLVRDLCIIYARLTLLCLVRNCENASSDEVEQLAQYLVESKDDSPDCRSNIDNLLYVLRLSSCYTSRTRGYVETLSRLTASQTPPPNLGSVLLAGGAPMLQAIMKGFQRLIFTGKDILLNN